MSDTQKRIDDLVKSSDVLLFMKGTASFPMCGFSGRAVQVLKACGVDPKTVQYLAGHENSKITMDIYAEAKYNKPDALAARVNYAFNIPNL